VFFFWGGGGIPTYLTADTDACNMYHTKTVRDDDLLKLSRHQLKMVTVIYTGHAPVRGHLYTMGLFDGDPFCRFCGMETETVQHIIWCCEV